MKKLFVVVMVLLLGILMAGCNKTEAKTAPGTQKELVWLTLSDWEGFLTPIIQKYEKETGVHIRLELVSFGDLFEVIEVKIASGSSDYDIISVDVPMVAAYATRGYILPLDSYYPASKKAQFVESAVKAGSWKGVFYAPPMNNSSQILFYNKSLLAQAGVTVPANSVENRLTWEQVVDMATATVNAIDPKHNQGISGLMFQQISRTNQMCALPNSLGEKSIGDDGFTADGVINTAGWIKAMNWYQNLCTNGLILRGITADETNDYFNAGKIVFMVGGTWTPGRVPNVDLGYAPMPAFKGYEETTATPTGSWHFGINKYSTKPEETAQFIDYMTLGEGNPLWLASNNDVPSTMAAVDAILKDPNADGVMKIAAYESLHTAVPRALTPGYTEYNNIIDTTMEDIRNGANVKTALDNAVRQLNMALAKYK